jgi:hypothetical protein
LSGHTGRVGYAPFALRGDRNLMGDFFRAQRSARHVIEPCVMQAFGIRARFAKKTVLAHLIVNHQRCNDRLHDCSPDSPWWLRLSFPNDVIDRRNLALNDARGRCAHRSKLRCASHAFRGESIDNAGAVFRLRGRGATTSRVVQRLVAKTPSSASCVLNPAFSNRLATSRGTSRSLVSLFGLPV